MGDALEFSKFIMRRKYSMAYMVTGSSALHVTLN